MNSEIIVFLGPSLPVKEAQKILPHALYYPPVKCGDILEVLKLPPKKIAIVDGYFENVGAVWHKEILFALTNHVKVYGASSMGALRAAELADFGMIGIGKIFKDFHQGKLEADDEVTVLHRPSQSGYVAVTDAMVNIRATLEKATRKNIIPKEIAEKLIATAKNLFYKKRFLYKAIEIFKAENPSIDIEAFEIWLNKGNFVDQKAKDTITLLKCLKENMLQEKPFYPLNRSIVLQKLLDRHYCEPIAHPAKNKKMNSKFSRYARLLAYAMKTGDRLGFFNLTGDAHEFNTIVYTIENEASNNHELVRFFYCLLLLFDTKLLEEFSLNKLNYSNRKEKNATYFKILLFCGFVIFNIYTLMKSKSIFLNSQQKKYYLEQLSHFFSKTYDKQLASNHYLVSTYFILKDILNNSMDAFLAMTSSDINKHYFELAQKILLQVD